MKIEKMEVCKVCDDTKIYQIYWSTVHYFYFWHSTKCQKCEKKILKNVGECIFELWKPKNFRAFKCDSTLLSQLVSTFKAGSLFGKMLNLHLVSVHKNVKCNIITCHFHLRCWKMLPGKVSSLSIKWNFISLDTPTHQIVTINCTQTDRVV